MRENVGNAIAGQTAEFFGELRDGMWAAEMFNSIPDIYFYVKDRDSRWMLCNDATARLLGVKRPDQVYGQTDRDYFPESIASAIRSDDEDVVLNGHRIVGRTETLLDEFGLLIWVSTNKIPLFGKTGQIVGLMGTTRVIRRYDELPDTHQPFGRVIEFIQSRISGPISIAKLSKEANLSASQFRKRFRRLFGISPNEFILRTRLQKAARLLTNSDDALIRIAFECGFCDQSYFTKKFRDFFGVTPRRYRQIGPHVARWN